MGTKKPNLFQRLFQFFSRETKQTTALTCNHTKELPRSREGEERTGKIFTYIDNDALREMEEDGHNECQVCHKQGVSVYLLFGYILKKDGTYDTDDMDSYVELACADCIRSGKIAHSFDREYVAEKHSTRANELKKALRRTPQLPGMCQHDDWVICCDDLCEYMGTCRSYEELLDYTEHAQSWDWEPHEEPIADFRKDGEPESLSEVSKFRCRQCQKQWWTFQHT